MKLIEVKQQQLSVAKSILDLSKWASYRYESYGYQDVIAIVDALADRAFGLSEILATEEFLEINRGNERDKAARNKVFSRALSRTWQRLNLVDAKIESTTKMMVTPRPNGVVLCVVPENYSVAWIFANAISILLARCAIVFLVSPNIKDVATHAIRELVASAGAAGAPEGLILQLDVTGDAFEFASELVKNDFLQMASTAYAVSATVPCQTMNKQELTVPVVVDATANLEFAASEIVWSKSFDNSMMRDSESILLVEDKVYGDFLTEIANAGAHIMSDEECEKVREAIYRTGNLAASFLGLDAVSIAESIGVPVVKGTKILLAPLEGLFDDDPVVGGNDLPILGILKVENFKVAIRHARYLSQKKTTINSAVLYSRSTDHITEFASNVLARQIIINAGSCFGGINESEFQDFLLDDCFVQSSAKLHMTDLDPQQFVTWIKVLGDLQTFDVEPIRNKTGSKVGVTVPSYPREETIRPDSKLVSP